MEKTQVRVLLVEDSKSYTTIVKEALKKDAHTNFDLTAVENLNDAFEALKTQVFGVIVLDLGLPDSDGLVTFQKIHAMAPETPTIIFSGREDDEVGLAAMQIGAQDYLIKNDDAWKLLGRSIRYAIERYQVNSVLHASEEYFRGLLKQSPVAYQSLDEQGRFLYVNEQFCKLTGYSEEEILGSSFGDLWTTATRATFPYVFERFKKQGFTHGKIQLVCKNGNIVQIVLDGRIQRDENNEFIRTHCIMHTATESEQLEEAIKESERNFETLANSGQALIWTSDVNKKCDYFNQRWLDFTGRTLEQELGDGWAEGVHPDDLESCVQTYVQAFDQREKLSMDYRLRRFDGTYRWIQDDGAPRYNIRGEFIGYIGYCLDITDRKEAEKQLRLQANLLAKISQAIIVTDLTGKITYWNAFAEKLYGWTNSEVIGKNIVDVTPSQMTQAQAQEIMQTLSRGATWSGEFLVQRKDGSDFTAFVIDTPYTDAEGNPAGIIGVSFDVSERKEAEAALRVKDQALHTSQNAIAFSDMAGNLTYVNPAFIKYWGYDNESEILGKSAIEFWDPAEKAAEVVNALQQYGNWAGELVGKRKDESTFDVQLIGSLIINEVGEPTGLLGTFIDITERKEAERKLSESETKYRQLFENVPVGMYRAKLDGSGYLAVNKKLCEILGKSKEELLNAPFTLQWLNPADRDQAISALLATGSVQNCEMDILRTDGQIRTCIGSAQINKEQGYFEGSVVDITERKQTEEKLRASERQMSALVMSLDDIVFEVDEQLTCLNVWVADESLLAKPKNDLLGYYIWKDFDEETARPFVEITNRAFATNSTQTFEYSMILQGEELWFSSRVSPIQANNSSTRTASIVIRNITEKKRTENALCASEAQYRLLTENMNDVVWLMDFKENKFTYVSPSVYKLRGYTAEEVMSMPVSEALTPASQEVVQQLVMTGIQTILSGQEFVMPAVEIEQPCKDGSTVWTEVATNFVLDENKMPAQIIGLTRDITERKKSEEALRITAEENQALINAIPDLLFRFNRQGKIIGYHVRRQSDLYVDPSVFMGKLIQDVLPPPLVEKIHAGINTVLATRELVTFEYELPMRGVQKYYESRMLLGAHDEILTIIRDITSQKETEFAKQEKDEQYRLLFETLMHGVVFQDANGMIIDANPMAQKILGLTLDQLQGRASIDPRWRSIHEDGSNFPGNEHPAMVALQTGQSVHNVVMGVYRPTSDSHCWINVNAVPRFKPGEEKPYQVYATFEDITERKEAEEALRRSQEQLRLVIEGTNDGIWDWNLETHEEYHSARWLEVLGYKDGELPNDDSAFFNNLHPDDRAIIEEAYTRHFEKNESYQVEMRLRHKDGSYRWVLSRGQSIRDANGKPIRMVGALTDITERKQTDLALRASEENYRNLVENSDSAIAVLSRNGEILYANPRGIQLWGDPNIVGKTIYDLYPSEYAKRYTAAIHQVIDTKTGILDEIQSPVNGHMMWFRLSMQPLRNADGTVDRLLLNGTDITEQTIAAQAVRESNERFTQIANNISDVFWIGDVNTMTSAYVSPAFESVFGISYEEAKRVQIDGVMACILPEDRQLVREAQEKQKRGIITEDIYRIQHPDGSIHWVQDKGNPIFDKNGAVAGVVGVARDITAQIESEERLRDSEARFRQMANNIQEVFWMFDNQQQKIVYISPAYETIWARTVESLYENSRQYIEVIHPDDRKVMFEALERQARGKKTEMEYRVIRPDGTERWIYDRSFPIFNANGVLTHTTGIAADVTERKHAEDALRENEARYRSLVENMSEFVAEFNEQGKYLYLSPSYTTTLGYSIEERLGKFVFDLIHPDDLPAMQKTFAQSLETGEATATFRVKHKNGEWRWIETSGRKYQNAAGELRGITVSRDITERKRAEDELNKLTERLNLATSSAKIGIWDWNLRKDEIILDDQVYKLYGRTKTQKTETFQSWMSGMHSENHVFVQDVMQQILNGATDYNVESRVVWPDGGVHWIKTHGQVFRDETGSPIRIVGVDYEITERKQFEADLSRSEENLKRAQSVAHLGSWIVQQGLDEQIWSDETYRIFNLPFGFKMTVDGFWDYVHPDDVKKLREAWDVALEGAPYDIEHRIIWNNGEVRWVHEIAEITFSAEGEFAIAFGTIQDITEKKQAEQSRQQSEEKYRSLVEASDAFIAMLDGDGRFQYLNEKAMHFEQTVIGVGAIGKRMHELVPAEIADSYLQQIKAVISSNQGFVFEAPVGQVWYRTSIQPIRDENGNAVMVLMSATDITDFKKAQQELVELNRSLEERVKERTAEVQDLYENAPTGYHSLDVHGNFVMINQTELNWLGYTREELSGRAFAEFMSERSREAFVDNFPVFKQRGLAQDIELELVRKDGSIFPILLSSTAIYDQNGNYVMSRSTVFDNTIRKQAEHALRESEQQNRLLFEEAPDAVVLINDRGKIVRINRVFEALTGYTNEVIGFEIDKIDLLLPSQAKQLAQVVQTAQESDNIASTEFEIIRTNGEVRSIEARVFALSFQNLPHFLISMHDVSASKQIEETLRVANIEMERALRAKDEFMANMSHELRTPLNAILGLSEGLLEQLRGPLNERQQASLRNIEASGRHLLSLINDILDLSKVEAGKLELQAEIVAVADVAHASLLFVKEIALKKRLKLAIHLNDQLTTMEADSKRLKQMLVNLLSNAVKFTPEGGAIELNVNANPNTEIIQFTVRDTGIGIANEDLNRLFQPFVQLDSKLSRQYEGTGLGLALVRRLAELHGGSVSVESELGKGSTFTIALPYKQPKPQNSTPATVSEEKTATPDVSPSARKERILLAEDNEINIMTIGDYLEDRGYQITVARNGREAIDLAQETLPDLILMDIQMPEVDGLEAIYQLRAQEQFTVIPIIALTALAMPGDRERCIAAGANDYLTKPVSGRELIEKVQTLLNPTN